jgi:hypothetical protein
MMTTLKKILACALLLIVVGCVTPPPNMTNLTKPASAKTFTLRDQVLGTQRAGPLATSPAEYGLASGTYVGDLENS